MFLRVGILISSVTVAFMMFLPAKRAVVNIHNIAVARISSWQ